jgi:alpha-maltose-1-phosphate synthase
MKFLVLYPYPVQPDGQSLQGEYLVQGLRDIGEDVMPCDREDSLQKHWAYQHFKPDAVIGVGFWGDTPRLIDDPQHHKMVAVPAVCLIIMIL